MSIDLRRIEATGTVGRHLLAVTVALGVAAAFGPLPARAGRTAQEGQPVVRLLDTDDNRDVAVLGTIRVWASRDAVVSHVLARRGVVLAGAGRFGVFGDPPVDADVRSVAFDRAEYKGLRTCRPGDCDFKLSAAEMRSYITEVDWSSPNAKQQADEVLRGQLLRLVTDYRQRGNAAMPTYDDGPGVRSADAFDAVLAQSAATIAEHAPELSGYLTTSPTGRREGAYDFIYWSEERRPRMRPTLTVNHVVAYAPPHRTALVVRKQIYASHYFEAGLEVLAVMDADTPGSAYLVSVRRLRFDYLPGGILNVRGRVRGYMVDAMRADLTRERAAIERPPATPQR